MTYHWNTPIRYVVGLGPCKTRELTKIGINTVGDLLERQPLSYIYPGATDIADASEGNVVIKAKLGKRTIRAGHSRATCTSATLSDDTGTCEAVWYGSASQYLHPGMTAIFYGKMKGGVLHQPKWTCVEKTMKNVYGGQYGTHHNTIRAALKEVLANVELPLMNNGGSRNNMFMWYHFPGCKGDMERAIHTLKHDEALQLQLALAERRRGKRTGERIAEWDGLYELGPEIRGRFMYDFTGDQYDAVCNIIDDLACDTPMQRLIHGEVGSGKTAVAFYAAMLAALNDKRTVILAPTTILAQQHFDNLRGMGWDDAGLHSPNTFMTDSTPNIIIGTHSMLFDPDLIKSASLVIIDEFQKFGVEQRAKIQKNNPHLLLLSATPIPRTLAATVFGDLDVSVIRQLPIKRGTIVTRWVLPEKREAMYEIVEKELAKGKQAYVVYPRISGGEDVVSAKRGFSEISYWFDMYRVKLLTGQASAGDKAGVLHEFYEGDTQILVSTIIAEVGLDNPNATVMCVEGADRFGLSQLHQLRGRVCRSTDTAFCFLVSETSNPTSIARLEVIEKTNCGFEIAEEDLRLRGAGEVFSTRQHGLPDLRWCSLVDDYDLMIEARNTVHAGDVGSGVREMMLLKYGETLGLGGVA